MNIFYLLLYGHGLTRYRSSVLKAFPEIPATWIWKALVVGIAMSCPLDRPNPNPNFNEAEVILIPQNLKINKS